MVYTKHFVIHTFDKLNNACSYIENAEKTVVKNEDTSSHLENLFQYIADDNKTMQKQLVSGYGIINPLNAYEEFKLTKIQRAFTDKKGFTFDTLSQKLVPPSLKELERKKAVLAHHVIQSFSPEDNLTPEKIHEIGYKTVMELTGGEYEFVIATHVDREHIHNHILFNSTNLKTGKAFRWQKGTKRILNQISDKISAQEGAKIIEVSPRQSHSKYTKWQTESLYKLKIKERIDFLLDHSSSIEDFLNKANALNLSVDFSKKWTTYKLLDEPQIKNTRGKSLSKKDPLKYNLEKIKEYVSENKATYSINDIVQMYEEKSQRNEQDFDFQLTIEDWQISHKTEKGYYLNVDYGFGNSGKIFIGGYKVDDLQNGNFNIYVKRDDYFYFMNNKSATESKYLTGASLVKQLRLYSGTTPLKKEPIMKTIDELIAAINFLAVHEIEDTRQLNILENKLEETYFEAEESLSKLDEKLITLHNISKMLVENSIDNTIEFQKNIRTLLPDVTISEYTLEDIQGEIESITLSQSLLESKLESTRKEINKLHEIQAVQSKKEEPKKENYPKL